EQSRFFEREGRRFARFAVRRGWAGSASSVVSRGFGVRLRLEGVKRGGPELIEVGANRFESGRVELVHSPCALGAIAHESCVLQDLEVLRDRRPADREGLGESSDRLRAPLQSAEDGAASRVAKGIQLGT